YIANGDRSAAVTGSNNLFFGNGSSYSGASSGDAPSLNSLTQSTFADPLFIDEAANNFHLSSNSPAAQGGAISASIADFDGLSLPQGSNYPIGAYAYPGTVGQASISVSASPSAVSLQGGQTQEFTAVVTNASNPSVTWSLNPLVGTISNAGLYTAPAIVPAQQTILLTAVSTADATKSAVATVSLIPISVAAAPATASLSPGQSQQFGATVSGAINPGVTWSLIPPTGMLSPSGFYTAPGSITVKTAVTIKAASVVDPTKFSSATVTLIPPPPVSVTVSPAAANLGASQTKKFSATVTGSGNTGVTWKLHPVVGSLSPAGLYTAPGNITTQQTATVTATSLSDATKFASATVTLTPSTPAASQAVSVTITQTAKGWQLAWTAPSGRPATDWLGLSSLHAPNWWTVWSEYTNGATGGSFTIPAPSAPGIYELRYFSQDTYTILTRSSPVSFGVAGFAAGVSPAGAPVSPGGALALSWTAGPGRTSGDYIGLYSTGAASDSPVWWEPTSGSPAGTSTGWGAPTTPGTYEFRYITGNGYICVAVGGPISVH
ncbi:MAG TPA: hypothetical protein VKG25_17730, partial [Bryobacteraceae bacterium]|nr:hypothetical protein [Bryobacteraceae bacterium]